jgi:hypothetical protein
MDIEEQEVTFDFSNVGEENEPKGVVAASDCISSPIQVLAKANVTQ